MTYKKPLTNTNRATRTNQHQREQGERATQFATHRHQADGAPQDSYLATVVRSVAYVLWTGGILLLASIIAVSVTSVLPRGPGGLVLIVTVVGLMAVAPIVARRTFATVLDVIESRRTEDGTPSTSSQRPGADAPLEEEDSDQIPGKASG